MRDDDCFEKEIVVANDTKSATTWRRRWDSNPRAGSSPTKRFRVFSTIMTFVVFSYRFQAVLSAQNHSCIKVFWHSPLKKA